ncbi:MAG: TIGR03118 family protein [Bryobacteraceae bacterium]
MGNSFGHIYSEKRSTERASLTELLRPNWLCAVVLLGTALLGGATGSLAAQTASTPQNNYLVHNLASDLANTADHLDPNLVNPWGVGFGPTPLWVGNNGTGTATLYGGAGAPIPLIVTIPQAANAGTAGPVTGVIFNTFASNANAFDVQAGKPALFMFCSEDGVISGWNQTVSGTKASALFDNSKSGAVYTGCALGGTAAAPYLFVANFNAGTVDVYDANFNLNPAPYNASSLPQPYTTSSPFSNPAIPAGFAPFNVQNIGGTLFVTYAKQDAEKHNNVGGAGNGYVAMFNLNGSLIANLIGEGPLNSPWGMAIAPANFGPFAGALLVGNFTDGKINAFNASTGAVLGTLDDTSGNPIAIPGLWSLNFGGGADSEDPGTLYITAGIGGGPNNDPLESHGLLASIQAAPSFVTAGIQNGASFITGPIAPNTWVQIKGNGLSETTGTWQVTSSTLPTQVNGVGVTVNGTAVPVSFVSDTQVNFLVPSTVATGPAQIQATNNGLTSAAVTANVEPQAPAFFTIGTNASNGNIYVAAEHADGTLIGPAATIKNATPAEPGETIVLFATGIGAPPASGQTLATPTIAIDGIDADVVFVGVVGPGLYQFNVVVPSTVTLGQDVLVVGLSANFETQPNAFLTIASQ